MGNRRVAGCSWMNWPRLVPIYLLRGKIPQFWRIGLMFVADSCKKGGVGEYVPRVLFLK